MLWLGNPFGFFSCTELSQLVVIGESLDFWKNSFGKSQDIAFFFEVKDIIISLKHGKTIILVLRVISDNNKFFQVLLAAAVCTRSGKALLSRQFVEMSKARIEGLLAAFPKLMPAGVKQHTFVETESVRYVYQPAEKVYVLLITTKTSNILEDLETLRLFARVVPEYCRNMEETDIVENAFQIIFAFDEIVALGYRESVNLAQIRTFVEMDSHEEKVYQAVRQTQEREAKQKMREKAKELQRQKMEATKNRGMGGGGGGSGGFGMDPMRAMGSSNAYSGVSVDTPAEPPKPTFSSAP